MKKLILLVVAVGFTTGVFAQDWTEARYWNFGAKAGVSFSNVSNMNAGDTKMLTGFYAGLFAEYKVNYWFGVQPEVMYSAQGTVFEPDGGGKYHIKQDYINIPILAKFYVADGFSVDLGPQFGFLVNDQVKVKTRNDDYEKAGWDIDTKTFDFSIALGLNYTVARHLDITARYNLGLSDTQEGHGKNRNGVIQLGLGYRF